MGNEVKATYIPFCGKHPSCCYSPDCGAELGYNPQNDTTFLVRCTSTCKF